MANEDKDLVQKSDSLHKKEDKNKKVRRKGTYQADADSDFLMKMHKTVGNQEVQRMIQNRVVQAKMTVGSPNDVYEKEADAVADKIVNMTDAQVQSKQNDESLIQSKGSPGGMDVPAGFESGLNSIKGTGSSLNKDVRGYYESRLNTYLGDVRVHTGNKADHLARSINAEAFTTGHDIVFAARNFDPATQKGKKLLGHELTHVLQQKGGSIQRKTTPAKTESPETLAKKMREAFRGLGTDEDEVYRILKYPPAVVREMINYYNTNLNDHTGQGFFKDVLDEFSGSELKKVGNLLKTAKVSLAGIRGSKDVKVRYTPLTAAASDPNKQRVGLLVRGMESKNHEPGVMDQHADVVVPNSSGAMETRGFFGEGDRGSSSGAGNSTGMGMDGVSADMAWFLNNRLHYVDLQYAMMANVHTSVIMLEVPKAQAQSFYKYWGDLKTKTPDFYILGKNCSTRAAEGLKKAGIIDKDISGLDTPDNLFQQIRESNPSAFMVSGYYGYMRPGRTWGVDSKGKPVLSNAGTGPWQGPFVAELYLG
ncbi:MAG: DUF4157 domain-containing protein [bacterium]|nr:DUF4157 domain-containing protein [bacterium]